MPPAPHGYREWAPHPTLAPFVECMWTKDAVRGAGVGPHRVLPDGCVDFLVEADSGAARFVGAMTRPVDAHPRGRIVAVRFRPGGAAALFGIPVDAWTDAAAPLDHYWRAADRVADRVASARDVGLAARSLEFELLARTPRPTTNDRLVLDAAGAIAADPSATSIGALADSFGVSRQHLTREFRARVGYGPKMLGRVLRLRKLLASIERAHGRARTNFAGLALAHGYCDQAHLANEVRALTGQRATELLRGSGSIPPRPTPADRATSRA